MSNASPVINGENTGSVDFRELRTGAAGTTTASGINAAAARAAYNMVAAMNEHLSTNARQNDFQSVAEDSKAGILSFPCDFDHMYASMTDGGAPATSSLGVSPLRGNEARHHDLTEVKHLKELLLLHLDLIQQQSEQIVTKDKLLAALRQENETVLIKVFYLLAPLAHVSLYIQRYNPHIPVPRNTPCCQTCQDNKVVTNTLKCHSIITPSGARLRHLSRHSACLTCLFIFFKFFVFYFTLDMIPFF